MTENRIDWRHLLKLIGAGGVALVGVGAEGGATLKPGTRRPKLLLAKKIAAGSAQLRVTLRDAAGNTKIARRTIQVPKSP